jgi:pimeloyl-ACP methyl ester carboxylesterase
MVAPSESIVVIEWEAATERIISSDGVPIAYKRSGMGPPLVLVHGLGRDHRSWSHLLPAFEAHFTVYAMDRRGRGKSGIGEQYSFSQEADDLLAIIDKADEPVHLLGSSLGAICALEAALRTSRIRSLILYKPPLRLAGSGPSLTLAAASRRARDDTDRMGVLAAIQDESPRVPDGWTERVSVARTYPRELRALYRYVFDPNRFRTLTKPTLLLLSDAGPGPSFFRKASDTLHAALADSRVVVLEGQGHLAIFTAPDLFARAVLDFLLAH